MTLGNVGGLGHWVSEFLIRRIVNAKARLARLMRPGSLVTLVVLTISGAAAALREVDLPSASFWQEELATTSLAVIAALSYVGYCLVVLGFRRLLKHSGQNARLYTTCRDMAALVERETSLPRECIGVHVWEIRGVRGIRRLERRATFVAVDRTESWITWRRGKGVIGQCWLRNEWVLADLSRMASARTEREFEAIPLSERFLFSWKEAKATAHYKAILAWPLHGGPLNARKVVGVLSIDAQEDDGAVDALDGAWTRRRADFDAHLAVCEAILEKG